ncbi:hypothetical protein H6P81_014141 [Aristolochia fimbriata]|uniref:Uncharacterized protein n=1 Tax=Aristolochia fimbriata TaxID=158543 RepID=A0AAV7EGN3_ARIFI|nr:hypothetical protein H6P81_014141 [Aristolochia fimbriata]
MLQYIMVARYLALGLLWSIFDSFEPTSLGYTNGGGHFNMKGGSPSCFRRFTSCPSPSLTCCPRVMDSQPEPVSYLCGDCGAENTLKPGDVIQCRECGYRILYKKRTRRIVQYEAR